MGEEQVLQKLPDFLNHSMPTMKVLLKFTLPALEGKGRQSGRKSLLSPTARGGPFRPLGLFSRFTKLDPGMENRFLRAPGTLDHCSRTEATQIKMVSGISLALATIHMFVQEKKVGARRHERLLLKKSLFVSATVVGLFREFILKVQLPQQRGQGQCQPVVC